MRHSNWLVIAALTLGTGLAAAQQAPRKSYIVQLADLPAAGYTGNVNGLAATKPLRGQKFDARSAGVQAYMGYLDNRRNAVLSTLGNVPVTHRYNVAFNGFAAQLTEAEVARLKADPKVLQVTLDEERTLSTNRTPGFLGLTGPGGLLTQGTTGEDVIIGIVDGGITPEHPSFSDKVDGGGNPIAAQQPGTVVYNPLPPGRFSGICEVGPGFPATDCNNKLVGARFFVNGLLAANRTLRNTEFASPRDADGHGTHTASTAGGNGGVQAFVNGADNGFVSGIAPRARIAAYKVCYLTNERALASCFNSDSVNAIDQAVADGVDVINYSISGTTTNYLDPVEVSFFFAADAGVFVAASAGNEGPGNTVAHMSPWITTVAASTHDRLFAADVTLGNGATFNGPSLQKAGLGSATDRKPLILSTEAGVLPLASLTPTQQAALRLCFDAVDLADASLLGAAAGPNAALDPAKVAGKIVVCDRGVNARVNKSAAVQAAGGIGMVMLNTAANTLNDDAHFVPTVHLSHTARATVRTYAAGGAGTAFFGPSALVPNVVAPIMATFSSRGPSLADPNILKPDITAPGVGILAGVAPTDATAANIAAGIYPPPAWDFLQGTSMSSPHIAGMAALIRQAHPTWSPAAIKSALMTSTTGVKLGNGAPDPDRFGYGAGHANPNAAAATKLVYDAGTPDYLAFLCGQGLLNPSGATCNAFGFLAAADLNLASLTSDVVGRKTLSRVVTNVGPDTTTFNSSVSMPGYDVVVSPPSLTLAPGASGSFSVTATRTTATLDAWTFGNLEWTEGTQVVRSPLTLRARQLVVPALIQDDRVRANKSFTIGTGYNGTLRTNTVGLVPATRRADSVDFGTTNCTAQVVVPAGAHWLRVALFNQETTGNGADDLDLIIRNAAGAIVGSSGGGQSNELVDLPDLQAGTYSLCVDGFGTSRKLPDGSPAPSSNYTLSSWLVATGKGLANSLRVSAPTNVAIAGTGTVSLLWSVPAGQRYFGTVQYTDGTGARIGRTALYIDNQLASAPVPVAGGKSLSKALDAAAR